MIFRSVWCACSFDTDCCCHCCADVEEMSDSLVSLLTADTADSGAVGDADSQRTSSVTLSASEYTSLLSRLNAAEQAARHTAEQLQQALSDLEKMRLVSLLLLICTDCRLLM